MAVADACRYRQAANQVEVHETVMERGIARMEALDSLVIPAGETLELRPGGKHIMLSQLTEDIRPNSRLAFRLTLDSGERIDLTAAVLDMLIGALEDDIEVGSLTFSQMWLRPASAGDVTAMNHASMDMEMNMDMEKTPSG